MDSITSIDRVPEPGKTGNSALYFLRIYEHSGIAAGVIVIFCF